MGLCQFEYSTFSHVFIVEMNVVLSVGPASSCGNIIKILGKNILKTGSIENICQTFVIRLGLPNTRKFIDMA